MKWILLIACGCSLLFTTGCLPSREEWRGHANNARFGGVAAGPSAVEVRAPASAVRQPQIIAREIARGMAISMGVRVSTLSFS